MEAGSYAKLEGRTFEFYMTKKRVVIGRNSKLGDVDVNMGSSRFISRKHLEIALDRNSFYILCRGKNGVFVDDIFQRRENKRMQLPNSCIIRFPSTQIKLAFTSLLEDLGPLQPMHSPALPLKVDPQFTSPFVSPMPSPTGTISAVNSCPVSPNSEYRHRIPNYDINAMAKFASKLLSSQQNLEAPASAVDGTEGGVVNLSEVPAPSNELVEIEEEEEPIGDVPGDQVADKPEESGRDDEEKGVSVKGQQKPPYSYAQLIVQALLASRDRRQTLSNIYSFISEKYPYYKLEDKGWKNSIRHNLSLNQYFMKAPREKEGLGFGKGGYWCMHPDYEEKLTAQAYVKRKKKGIPVFPSAGLISRSAPASPTHHPMMHSELTFKDLDTKFPMPTPPTTSHFTLPTFYSQMPGVTANSSHSLPASPSRPPHAGFTATPIKFFPMAIRGGGGSADDMVLMQKHHAPPMAALHKQLTNNSQQQRKHNMAGEEEANEKPPPIKRVRIDDRPVELDSGARVPRPMQVPTLSSLPTGAGGIQLTQPPNALQFLTLPIMTSSGMAAGQPAHQNLLTQQPMSTYLPPNYFTAAGTSPHPTHNLPEARNNSASHGNNNEG